MGLAEYACPPQHRLRVDELQCEVTSLALGHVARTQIAQN